MNDEKKLEELLSFLIEKVEDAERHRFRIDSWGLRSLEDARLFRDRLRRKLASESAA